MLTHGNMLASLEQVSLWISQSFKESLRDRHRAAADVSHLLPHLDARLSKMGQHDPADHQPARPAGLRQGTRKWKVQRADGVNTLFNGLMNTPGFEKLDFSALKVVVGGGASVQKGRRRTLAEDHRHLPDRGLRPDRNLAGRLLRRSACRGMGTIGCRLVDRSVTIRDEIVSPAAAVDRQGRDRKRHKAKSACAARR